MENIDKKNSFDLITFLHNAVIAVHYLLPLEKEKSPVNALKERKTVTGFLSQSAEEAPFRWQVDIEKMDQDAILRFYLQDLPEDLSNDGIVLHEIEFIWDLTFLSPLKNIYLNGFQSWTDSREFSPRERIPRLSRITTPLKMRWFGDTHFFPYSGESGILHGYTYSYLRTKQQDLLLFGSTSEDLGYTIFIYDANKNILTVRKDLKHRPANKEILISLFAGGISSGNVAHKMEEKLFDSYFALFNNKNSLISIAPEKKQKNDFASLNSVPALTGWTSWYNYYTNINEKVLLDNLAAFEQRKIPIDVFQIDDGFQKHVGDWLRIKEEKFSQGMGFIADRIHVAGFKAGLWLAPFICEKDSWIMREKKHWIKRNARGKMVVAGWNPLWSGNFYALDFYQSEVREYLTEVFTTVLDKWHFDLVKLDFLYAVAIEPTVDKSRGAIMSEAMAWLRSIVGKKWILGCGVPLGAAFHRVDYCRIGSDIALKWEDKLLHWFHYRERVSTINSLTSTIGRHHLNNRVFGNDPDVFVLRSEKNNLTPEQRKTLFTLNNLFGGLLFTSDEIDKYDADTLSLYLSMFPFQHKQILSYQYDYQNRPGIFHAHFELQSRRYALFTNFADSPREIEIENHWHFSSIHGFLRAGAKIQLKAYSTLIALEIDHKDWDQQPKLVGTIGHLFPGAEIDSIIAMPLKPTKGKKNKETESMRSLSVNVKSELPYSVTVFILVPEKSDWIVNNEVYSIKEIGAELMVLECGLKKSNKNSTLNIGY